MTFVEFVPHSLTSCTNLMSNKSLYYSRFEPYLQLRIGAVVDESIDSDAVALDVFGHVVGNRPESKSKCKVRIGMTTFNRVDVLKTSILSALDQDYPDKKVFVVDDASTDSAVRELVRFRKRNV